MMTNASQQSPMQGSMEGVSLATVGAGVLILVGVAFEVAQLGYAHLTGDGLWFFSVLASNIWNMLALRFNAPAMQQVTQFWPLVLIGAGLAMLLAKQQGHQRGNDARRTGDRDAR
jgi:hypothetical protein